MEKLPRSFQFQIEKADSLRNVYRIDILLFSGVK